MQAAWFSIRKKPQEFSRVRGRAGLASSLSMYVHSCSIVLAKGDLIGHFGKIPMISSYF